MLNDNEISTQVRAVLQEWHDLGLMDTNAGVTSLKYLMALVLLEDLYRQIDWDSGEFVIAIQS